MLGSNKVIRRCLAIAISSVAVAACGDGGTASEAKEKDHEPVPWSTLDAALTARRGEYQQVLTIDAPGNQSMDMEEWVTFDLDAKLFDRAILMGPDLVPGDEDPTREDPSLRFFYSPEMMYMRHPAAEEQCGTPWVEMPPDMVAEATGFEIDLDGGIELEPLVVLGDLDPPEPASTDEEGTTYEVLLPGGTGIPSKSGLIELPDVAERITALEHEAQVFLPRDGGPIEVTIDLSNAAAEISDQPGQVDLLTKWTITAPLDAVDLAVPADAASREECPDVEE